MTPLETLLDKHLSVRGCLGTYWLQRFGPLLIIRIGGRIKLLDLRCPLVSLLQLLATRIYSAFLRTIVGLRVLIAVAELWGCVSVQVRDRVEGVVTLTAQVGI